MSKLTDKRWTILSKFFTKLKQLSEDKSVILMYDDGNMTDMGLSFKVDEATRYARFESAGGCTWGVFDESEHDDKTSATSIINEMRERIVACKRIKF